MDRYQIIDEPKPGVWSRFTVDPMWPLFGFMLGGSIFSWLWYAFNSFALNGPNRNKELLTILVAFTVFFAVYIGADRLFQLGFFETINKQYFVLFSTCVQLVFCYTLFMFQKDGFDVYEYFGGSVFTPFPGLILAFMFGSKLQVAVLTLILGGS